MLPPWTAPIADLAATRFIGCSPPRTESMVIRMPARTMWRATGTEQWSRGSARASSSCTMPPPRRRRWRARLLPTTDQGNHRERHHVKRTIGRLKALRRGATALVKIAAIVLLWRSDSANTAWLLVSVVLGVELAVADAAQDRPALGLPGRDPDGALGIAVTDQLGAVERLAPTVAVGVAVALVLAAGAGVGLALAGQAETAEGVQVQGDRAVEVADRLGVDLAGVVGELDVGEAVDRVDLGVGGPLQAQLGGQLQVAAVMVLALAAGVFDPADLGQRVGGLVQDRGQRVGGALCEALPGHKQLRLAVGCDLELGVLASFGGRSGDRLGAAVNPALRAEVARAGIDAGGGGVADAGAGDEHPLGQVRVLAADGGPGVLQGGDEAGPGGGRLGG